MPTRSRQPRAALRLVLTAGAAAASLAPCPARAQTPPPIQAESITVIGTSPLIGGGVDSNLVPANIQTLTATDLSRGGTADPLAALNTEAARVNLGDPAGNPYQPTLFYDGFEASPLQGTPEGIAVYLNGVRFNQPFGDTVNWDLIPDNAIGELNVEGSNPVYGLNALGGAINVRLKDGFTDQGGSFDVSGGSFDQIDADLDYGAQRGNQSVYAAMSEHHEGGWRDLQSSDIQNFFGDWGIRTDAGAEFHATLTMANSVLNGPGTAPVELLAADPRAQFTGPNVIANRFIQPALRFDYPLTNALSLQGTAYYNYFLQRVLNGNAPNDSPCDDGSGLLCQDVDDPSTTRNGAPIPAFLGQGPYSELDTQTTNTNAYGAAAQLTDSADLFGLPNHLVAGASFDGANTAFSATAFIGGLTPLTRVYDGQGYVIDEPGNNVPVRVAITDANAGGFASNTLNLTRALALTVSGRFNFDETDLADQGGGDLTGNHAFARFNPAIGATWRALPFLTVYGGYSEANRAPTPAELSCAGPQNSCSLANFFVGDPDLKQVVAHTLEAGLRSRTTLPALGALHLIYDLGVFRTDSDDDIEFINSVALNRAYFANVGQTRRQGGSAKLTLTFAATSLTVAYTYTDATFQTGFTESAGSNPAGDANGNITIHPGDTLPGIPRSVLKLSADTDLTRQLHLGADAILQTGQFLFGDEANLTPRLPGFFALNLHARYNLRPWFEVFANADNVLNRRYYQFGTFSPTSSIYLAQAPNATNPRAYNLAAPLGGTGGIKISF